MKKCKTCKKNLSSDKFSKKSSKKDGLDIHCKICKNAKARKYYKDTNQSPKVIKRNCKRKNILTDFLLDYLNNNPCIDCGEKDIRVLEFDHVRGEKSFNVYSASGTRFGLKTLKKEVLKCEIRCRNCHKLKTAKDYNQSYYHWYEQYLAEGKVDYKQ